MAKMTFNLFASQDKALAFVTADKIITVCGDSTAMQLCDVAFAPCMSDGELFDMVGKVKGALQGKSVIAVLSDCMAFTDFVSLPSLGRRQVSEALKVKANLLYKDASEIAFYNMPLCGRYLVVGIKKSVIAAVREAFAGNGLKLCGITLCGEVFAKALCRSVPAAKNGDSILTDGQRLIYVCDGVFAGDLDVSRYGDCISDVLAQNSIAQPCEVYKTGDTALAVGPTLQLDITF